MESNNIDKLLAVYFEGNSSLEEEAILLDYFNNHKVADHLLQYKPIFVGLSAARNERSSRNFKLEDKKVFKSNTWRYAVAALFLVAFGVGGFFLSQPQMTHEEKEALVAFENSKKAMMMLSENFNKGAQQLFYVDQFDVAKDKFWRGSSE